MTMKRQHILIMHMHIHPLTLSVAYIFRKNLYNLNMTSTGTVMWCDEYYQTKPKQNITKQSREQSREQSKDSHTHIHIHLIIDSNQIKSNHNKDMLLDSDDNLLYDSDSIPFDLIRFHLTEWLDSYSSWWQLR